jgi:DNA-binding CsgD family transcriptional regulator
MPEPWSEASAWIADISATTELAGCVEVFRAIVARFHVNAFATGEIDFNYRNRSAMFVVEWPEAWRKFYLEGMFHRDPIVAALATRRGPFTWSELIEDETLGAAEKQVLRLAFAAGWEEGLVVPIRRAERRFGLISLVRPRGAFSLEDKTVLSLISVYFHEHSRSLGTARSFAVNPAGIPNRVIDCLGLAAAGLSDAKIALRLGISTATAHEYVESAKKKLGAKTRTEAVAIAVSLGIINV